MTTLRVTEIFDSLQGEGYWTGYPMTFVRLAGCNATEQGLACVEWCDTPESWESAAGRSMAVTEVLDRVTLPRLCLTGGEPLLQLDAVVELVAGAHGRGVRVHAETNGTVAPDASVPARRGRLATGSDRAAGGGAATSRLFDWVVVSPKPPAYHISQGWKGLIDELKLVVDDVLDAAVAERLAAAHAEAVVSIQPLSGAPWSVKRAIDLVMTHPEWRLSLQIHKVLGLR